MAKLPSNTIDLLILITLVTLPPQAGSYKSSLEETCKWNSLQHTIHRPIKMTGKFAKTSIPVKHLLETAILEVRSRGKTPRLVESCRKTTTGWKSPHTTKAGRISITNNQQPRFEGSLVIVIFP
jgi:hypothetical protein